MNRREFTRLALAGLGMQAIPLMAGESTGYVRANIVTAHDAGEHEGVHYLVMQFVDGKNLAAILKEKGPLPIA